LTLDTAVLYSTIALYRYNIERVRKMKKLIILILVIGIAALGYWYYKGQKNKKVVEVSPVNKLTEEEMKMTPEQKLGEMNIRLRTAQTALMSFYIDEKRFPEELKELTTPIAYLSRYPTDLFQGGAPLNYQKVSTNHFRVWSVGPDGKDDHGEKVLDEKEGINGLGDMVFSQQGE